MIKVRIDKKDFKEIREDNECDCADFECSFSKDEIKELVDNSELTDEQVLEIANVLLWNLEVDYDEAYGTEISTFDGEHFNDSFEDILQDLDDEYGR